MLEDVHAQANIATVHWKKKKKFFQNHNKIVFENYWKLKCAQTYSEKYN